MVRRCCGWGSGLHSGEGCRGRFLRVCDKELLMRRMAMMLVAWGVFGPAAWADSLVLNNKLSYTDITITGVEGDQLRYTFRGNPISRPISEIAKLTVEGEPAFTAA